MLKVSGNERQTRQLTAAETAATIVRELKEELCRILQENEELKSKCSYLELRLTNQPEPDIQAVESEHGTTCDKGVQCDLCCNEHGFRNSLQGNMEQQQEDRRREVYVNQQVPLNGDEPLIKEEILEPALVHTKVPNDVPDSVTRCEKGQKVDHNNLLTAGNMLCHFERVEEFKLESPPEEGQLQNISQEVFRVDESMANEDKVTMQTSSNRVVISEHPIHLSDEMFSSMKGASCDSGIGLKEIGVDVQTESSAQINERRSPLKIRGICKVPYPHVNLAIRNCLSIISAATSRGGRPPKKASLSELHTKPEVETSPVLRRHGRRHRSFVEQPPLLGTMSPPLTSDVFPAKKASEGPSKHTELDQDGRVPCLAASFPKGYFSEDAELSGLHQIYKEMENGVPIAAERLEPPLSELPKSKSAGTRTQSRGPERQEALRQVEAMNPQTSTLDAFEKSFSQPKTSVPAPAQNTAGFTSSSTPSTPSVSISSVSLQTKAKDCASYPSALVCQMSDSLPTLDQSTKIHSVPELPPGTGNLDVSASTPSAVVPSKTRSKSSTKLKQHAVIIPKSNNASGATCTRAQSRLQNSFTSISTVEASCERLGVSNTKDIPETKFASTQTIMQGKSSNRTDIEENAACLKTENVSFASERPCFVNCGPKSSPATLTKVQPSTVASTQSPLSTIRESCSESKALPVSSPSSSSSNKAFTKGQTVKALKQVAKEETQAAPTPPNNDPVHPLPEITKTQFFAQLSMAPVVPRQEKESLNDSVDCVVAETATHNTQCRIRLEGAGPSHGAETTSKPPEDAPEDEYHPDEAGELAQKPDAASPKYNANKATPCSLKGFRPVTNKLSSSAKKRRLNPEKPRPKESVGLVNNAFTLRTIKTEAVWIPPILEASKPELGNESRCDRLPTKWSTRYATLLRKRLTSPRLVTRKRRPPFTQSGSSSNNSPSAPRTVAFSHGGSTHPTPAETSPLPSTSRPFPFNRESLLRNQCEQCGRILSSKAALQKHTRLHSGKKLFSCTLCSQTFPDSQALTRHGRVHRNGKIYICPQCNDGFAYRFGLTQHLQTVHSRIKPFVCHICQKSYFRRKDFESHFRAHTGTARQFPCALCDKRFNRRVELDVHLRSHSREKRHGCPYCEKEFLDYNNLKRHKYTHTGERPYACAHCTKSFVQSGHLKKHLRNVHKVDVYADLQ